MSNIESEEHQCPKPSPFPVTTICFSEGCVLFSLCSISSRHIDKVKHFSYFSLGCYLAPVNIAAAFVFLEAWVEGERKTLFRGVLLRFSCSQSSHLGELKTNLDHEDHKT